MLWGASDSVAVMLSAASEAGRAFWGVMKPVVELVGVLFVQAIKTAADIFTAAFSEMTVIAKVLAPVIDAICTGIRWAIEGMNRLGQLGGNSLVDGALERYGAGNGGNTTYDNSSRSMTFNVSSQEQASAYADRFGGYPELDPGV